MATITTRAGKGSPLTNTEVDANFTNLNTDKLEAGDDLGTPSAVVLTNATSLPSGSLTGTVAVANGGTGSSTASGALTNLGLTATAVELNYTEGVTSAIQAQLNYSDDRTINALGSVSGTTDIDLADGTNVTATIAAATTFTISGITSGSVNTVTLYLTNAGAYTITWPSGTTFNRNAAPVLPASGDTIIVLETYDNATSYAGIQVWRSV